MPETRERRCLDNEVHERSRLTQNERSDISDEIKIPIICRGEAACAAAAGAAQSGGGPQEQEQAVHGGGEKQLVPNKCSVSLKNWSLCRDTK